MQSATYPRNRKLTHGVRAFAATLLLVCLPARGSVSETVFTAKDGQVLGRTMGYVGSGMTGLVTVGIAVGDMPASRREAELVRGVIGDGFDAGRVRLRSRLVPVDQLATLSGVDVLFVTPGIGAGMTAVASAAQRLSIPTVSTDMACVEAASCVVGFSTEPTVQIVISRAAADRAGVRFVQAFRMLVKER